jgi:hypothetical protein
MVSIDSIRPTNTPRFQTLDCSRIRMVRKHVACTFQSLGDDDAFAGPEIGFSAGALSAKVAYDIPFNRGLDEGIIATTIGFGFRF